MDPFFARAPPRVVFVIIDDEEPLALTTLALQLAGFHAIGSSSVQQAVARAPLARPDAIITDLRGGSSQDWKRLRQLQAGTSGAHPSLVMVIDPGDAVPPALASWCAATMERPVEADAVVNILRTVLA